MAKGDPGGQGPLSWGKPAASWPPAYEPHFLSGEKIMNRLARLLLAVITLIVLPTFPRLGFAQSDPFLGVWQLNVAKSKYSPGQPPKKPDLVHQG
jgi:hypothetical protein